MPSTSQAQRCAEAVTSHEILSEFVITPLLAFFVAVLAAELLELGEHGADIEIAAARFVLGFGGGGGYFRLLARGRFRGGEQSRAGVGRRRLFLVGAIDLEI